MSGDTAGAGERRLAGLVLHDLAPEVYDEACGEWLFQVNDDGSKKCADDCRGCDAVAYVLSLVAAVREAEAERDRAERALRHFKECADTPLMRDVLAERDAAVARAERAERALRDFAEHGTRYDLNPTRMIRNDDGWMMVDSYWTRRVAGMDNAVRERAARGLAAVSGEAPTVKKPTDLLPCYCHGDELVPYCPRHTPLPGEAPTDE